MASLLAEASSNLLAADDVFGEVFMAGMAIAFAGVGATVFVGILVRGKYDDIEQSFFDSQDEEVARETASSSSTSRRWTSWRQQVKQHRADTSSRRQCSLQARSKS